MNRRDAIKAGVAGIVGAQLAKKATAKDKLPKVVRLIDEDGYYNLYSDCTFFGHQVICHKTKFVDCIFANGWVLCDGAEGTEFHGCLNHINGSPMFTDDPAYKNIQYIDSMYSGDKYKSHSMTLFFRPVGVFSECMHIARTAYREDLELLELPKPTSPAYTAWTYTKRRMIWSRKELLGKAKYFVV